MYDVLSTKYHVRLLALVSIAVVVVLGFGFKWYGGPGRLWFNNSGAAVFYEIFWCLAAFTFFPSAKYVLRIAASVFVITCALEFLQLSNAGVLIWIRSFRIGQYVIGTTFVWSDFIYYVIGCFLGWGWMKTLASPGMFKR